MKNLFSTRTLPSRAQPAPLIMDKALLGCVTEQGSACLWSNQKIGLRAKERPDGRSSTRFLSLMELSGGGEPAGAAGLPQLLPDSASHLGCGCSSSQVGRSRSW